MLKLIRLYRRRGKWTNDIVAEELNLRWVTTMQNPSGGVTGTGGRSSADLRARGVDLAPQMTQPICLQGDYYDGSRLPWPPGQPRREPRGHRRRHVTGGSTSVSRSVHHDASK